MTREQLNKLRGLAVAFDVQAQKNFLRADATMDEESEACERVARAFNSCAVLLDHFISEEGANND